MVAAAPVLASGVAAALLLTGWAFGGSPFWYVPDLTLAEAVVTRDSAEVVRLIEYQHVDPNRRWPVRPELAGGHPQLVTPLEAAIQTRRVEMVRLLFRYGVAIPDETTRMALACLAFRTGADDVLHVMGAGSARDELQGRCPQ